MRGIKISRRQIAIHRVALIALSVLACSPASSGASDTKGAEAIEMVAKEASEPLRQATPQKLKTRGKPKVVRWEDLDAALAKLPARVDYPALHSRLREMLSRDTGFSPKSEVLSDLIEKTLARQEIPYAALFALNDTDLMPITNSVLKFLPDEAWKDIAVFNRKGERIGNFVGKFAHEKSGGLAISKSYRIYYFQYRDKNDVNQVATADYLERDEYCVEWADIKQRPAFTLATLKP
ncbi:MAG: hypothetical protein HYR55_12940 [Acidobacteria bacterium]|nr:hypothetical protein [Acidobacteriota bacterium]MBI3657891.1 hypothetical protein [Acidobacteriota bacterium]